MAFVPKCIAVVVLLITVVHSGPARANDSTALLRFLSFTLTDHPPSSADAQSFAAGEMDLDTLLESMLTSERHQERIARYFNDWFGSEKYPGILVDDVLFMRDEDGVYQPLNPEHQGCNAAEALSVSAWWATDDVKFCPQFISDTYCPGGAAECDDDENETALSCGPMLVACFPAEEAVLLETSLSSEFAARAVQAYQHHWSWMDLLGGDNFFGNRLLYHYYLFSQTILAGQYPTAADFQSMRELDLRERGEVYFPDGAERAGVVTGPMFLTRFNNFRSRIRALTNQLLCHDVDGSTNVDQTREFINPDFSEADLAHGARAECAGCHYAMDNLGSTIMAWSEEGVLWDAEGETPSTMGHAFGQTGHGPAFLVEGYIQRGPGFAECMAKTAWTEFSGIPWSALDPTVKETFVDAVADGPRSLLRAVMKSDALRAVRR